MHILHKTYEKPVNSGETVVGSVALNHVHFVCRVPIVIREEHYLHYTNLDFFRGTNVRVNQYSKNDSDGTNHLYPILVVISSLSANMTTWKLCMHMLLKYNVHHGLLQACISILYCCLFKTHAAVTMRAPSSVSCLVRITSYQSVSVETGRRHFVESYLLGTVLETK